MNTEQIVSTENGEFMRKPEVLKRTALSDSIIRRLELKGFFPKRRLIGERTVGWYRKQVMDWLATREIIEIR